MRQRYESHGLKFAADQRSLYLSPTMFKRLMSGAYGARPNILWCPLFSSAYWFETLSIYARMEDIIREVTGAGWFNARFFFNGWCLTYQQAREVFARFAPYKIGGEKDFKIFFTPK